MNSATPRPARLEWLLAEVLQYGSRLAAAIIAFGLGLALIDSRAPKLAILRDMRIATIGIALFILLPVTRLTLMLIFYVRQRDYRLGAVALLVLTIILLGFAVSLVGSRHQDAPRISDAHAMSNGSALVDPTCIPGVKFFPDGKAEHVQPPRVSFPGQVKEN
jgi:hypothetical protein